MPLPRGLDAETSLGRHELGEEWKPLSQILTALRAHDGRIENQVQDLVEIYMPPDPPETREKEVVVVAQDGEVTRTGVWRGPESSSPEYVIREAKVPAWRERPGAGPQSRSPSTSRQPEASSGATRGSRKTGPHGDSPIALRERTTGA